MKNWINEAVFYHIYPLGFCGAPRFHEENISHSINKIIEWIPHLKQLNINAIYLGPVFESFEHGYDTSDYRTIDHRLGDNKDFKRVCEALHEADIQIVLDGVFNHVGREFWAFRDVVANRESSAYKHWFKNLRFDQNNSMNDGFRYDTWQGYHNLVKLNLQNEDVVHYLLESVGMWMDEFHINGLRLDAADCIDKDFFRQLKQYCKKKDEHFWLMGEIIHGDYTMWANKEMLDSVTNYECYKGIYSSHNDANYFEIGHSLNRQFKQGGIYEHLHLYNFVDNHDVNRLASTIKNQKDLRNIYTLLYTIPGVPSVYYGSEWAMEGKKHDGSDADIRPQIELSQMEDSEITHHIAKLGQIRQQYPVLFDGCYEPVVLKNEQFVFVRGNASQKVYIALNVGNSEQEVVFDCDDKTLHDILHHKIYKSTSNMQISIPAKDSCILIPTNEECVLEASPLEKKETLEKEVIPTVVSTPELPLSEELAIGKYEHYKGKHYAVLYTATHSETLEQYVVYRQLYGAESVWIRPLAMFKEHVTIDGKEIPRFKYIGK